MMEYIRYFCSVSPFMNFYPSTKINHFYVAQVVAVAYPCLGVTYLSNVCMYVLVLRSIVRTG